MACRLLETEPLCEPVLNYSELAPYEQTSVVVVTYEKLFIQKNFIESCSKWCVTLDEIIDL